MRCPICGMWTTRDASRRMFSCVGSTGALTKKGQTGCGWRATDRDIGSVLRAAVSAAKAASVAGWL